MFLCGLRARKSHLDFVPHPKANKDGNCVTKLKFICAFICIQYCECLSACVCVCVGQSDFGSLATWVLPISRGLYQHHTCMSVFMSECVCVCWAAPQWNIPYGRACLHFFFNSCFSPRRDCTVRPDHFTARSPLPRCLWQD